MRARILVGWARELPADQPIKIIVYLPSAKAHQPPAAELGEAFSHYFDYRADVLKRDLNELFVSDAGRSPSG